MSASIENRIALVTGGSQGIGKAISQKLLNTGAIVAIAALDDNSLKTASAEFQNSKFKSYAADLLDELQIDSVVRSVVRDLGPIDILINNAGITGPTLPAHEVPILDWDRTLNINLRT